MMRLEGGDVKKKCPKGFFFGGGGHLQNNEKTLPGCLKEHSRCFENNKKKISMVCRYVHYFVNN